MSDVVVVGGGVIGLTIAREMARAGRSVTLLERGDIGRQASWAGAGILPPGYLTDPADQNPETNPLPRWTAATHQLWPGLSAELLDETGIDNGYRRCGGIELAHDVSTIEELTERRRLPQTLSQQMDDWEALGVAVERISTAQLRERVPGLATSCSRGFILPDLCQVRNPHHLKALQTSCRQLGVALHPHQAADVLEIAHDRIISVRAGDTTYSADQFIIAAGAWSTMLLGQNAPTIQVEPVRGQIVLLKLPTRPFVEVIECGSRYLVPREDGHVLIGATEEWVGFDPTTTAAGIDGLMAFAVELIPELADANVVRSWAGLRPHAPSARPFIGPVPGIENLHAATGHFRAGLHLSPLTAQLIAQGLESPGSSGES